MQLVKPDIKYEDSYKKALEEAGAEIQDSGLAKPSLNQTFAEFIAMYKKQEEGKNLPEGYVPASMFWLIDKNEFIGRLQIRHKLNKFLFNEGGHIGYFIRPSKRRMGYGKKILQLGLEKAKKLGIKNVLITCDITNAGSKKIIESQNATYASTYAPSSEKPAKLRYWINIK